MNIEKLINSDLGENIYHLHDCVKQFENGVFVDLGVRAGISSEIMLDNAHTKNNKVYGVDVTSTDVPSEMINHPNYIFLLADSVTSGKLWNSEKVNILFVDTFHIKEQVMMELYYWYPHMSENSYIVFHDSNWPEGKYDRYGNIVWPRVEEGIKDFFGIEELSYKDDSIEVFNYPASWGMTIVKIKNKKDYISLYNNWDYIFERRNHLISLFWNESNRGNVNIDLILNK